MIDIINANKTYILYSKSNHPVSVLVSHIIISWSNDPRYSPTPSKTSRLLISFTSLAGWWWMETNLHPAFHIKSFSISVSIASHRLLLIIKDSVVYSSVMKDIDVIQLIRQLIDDESKQNSHPVSQIKSFNISVSGVSWSLFPDHHRLRWCSANHQRHRGYSTHPWELIHDESKQNSPTVFQIKSIHMIVSAVSCSRSESTKSRLSSKVTIHQLNLANVSENSQSAIRFKITNVSLLVVAFRLWWHL